MSVSCNHVCIKYKALMPGNTTRYTAGQKRCNSCGVFLFWDGLRCPCCNNRLRLAPRSSKYKEKFLHSKSAKKEISINGV
ncbi:MAG: hypothetical protein OEL56_02235 [Nitrosopumilus sp.]|nr:hypothetical protein [Nitrosopumilus sp.]MDH3489246.1 hypothetical protein [Nitrosopumilus sp.]MDH5416802.1 hypothetical protein [Nitrosopumilus sp.]